MADIVVTVPKSFQYKGLKGLAAWVSEGDPAGEEWSGTEWGFFMRGNPPTRISPGERVYVVCENKLRGYSPLIRIHNFGSNHTRSSGVVMQSQSLSKIQSKAFRVIGIVGGTGKMR